MDASGRALPADRSRIRSKAALEKNKRADSRRSRREAKRLALLEKEAASRVRPPSPPPHDLQLVPFAEKIDIESQELLHKGAWLLLNTKSEYLLTCCSFFSQDYTAGQASTRTMYRLYLMGRCVL